MTLFLGDFLGTDSKYNCQAAFIKDIWHKAFTSCQAAVYLYDLCLLYFLNQYVALNIFI